MGWVVVIAIVALLGNVYLFSGYDIEGEVATYLVGIAIVVDAFVVFSIGYLIYDKIRTKKQAVIDNIVTANYPEHLSIHVGNPIDVSNFVNDKLQADILCFKSKRDKIVEKCVGVNAKLINLLSCPNCDSIGEKKRYLDTHIDEIRTLKAESDALKCQIDSLKFSIPDVDNLQTKIAQAFESLRESKKRSCDGGDIETIVFNNYPNDLLLFDIKKPIVALKMGENYFCLIGDVILAFDINGYFSSVLKKESFKIEVQKKAEQSIYYSNAASDSKLVKGACLTYTWLHTCIDGTPDMRYKYNPRLEEWVDGYEYGIITIRIATYELKINVSSQKAIEAFSELAEVMK